MLVLLNCISSMQRDCYKYSGNEECPYSTLDYFIIDAINKFLSGVKYIDIDDVETFLCGLNVKYKIYTNNQGFDINDNGLLYKGAVLMVYGFNY